MASRRCTVYRKKNLLPHGRPSIRKISAELTTMKKMVSEYVVIFEN